MWQAGASCLSALLRCRLHRRNQGTEMLLSDADALVCVMETCHYPVFTEVSPEWCKITPGAKASRMVLTGFLHLFLDLQGRLDSLNKRETALPDCSLWTIIFISEVSHLGTISNEAQAGNWAHTLASHLWGSGKKRVQGGLVERRALTPLLAPFATSPQRRGCCSCPQIILCYWSIFDLQYRVSFRCRAVTQ